MQGAGGRCAEVHPGTCSWIRRDDECEGQMGLLGAGRTSGIVQRRRGLD